MIILLIGFFVCLFLLYFLYRGPIYLPTQESALRRMLQLADIKPGMRVADLGSGDGRIVIAFARSGAYSVGFEINPLLVWLSRYKINKLKLGNRAEVKLADFWHADLSSFDVIVVFGMTHIMEKLERKLQAELKPGALVISNIFKLPNWPILFQEGSIKLYSKL